MRYTRYSSRRVVSSLRASSTSTNATSPMPPSPNFPVCAHSFGRSEAELGRWRDALSKALGPHGQLVSNLVPELELVIGRQPPVPELPPHEAQNRFQTVFRRFLSVFARKEHPLALFLDDLQWLDTATIELLEHIVTHSEVRYLLLIGAYRDNEVGATTHFDDVRAIRNAGARCMRSSWSRSGSTISACSSRMRCSASWTRAVISAIGASEDRSNPFFAIQFFMRWRKKSALFQPSRASFRLHH